MEDFAWFKDVAPYLMQPLVLVGFVLLIVFGVNGALLKAGIIPPLTPRAGGTMVQNLVRYGFVIALLVIVLGFAFAFYQAQQEHSPAQETSTLKQSATTGQGRTAANAGRDANIGTQPSSQPLPVENAPSPSAGKGAPPLSVNQDAKAEGGGMAINAGRDVNIHK
jgi:hypothetical protein